MAVHLYFGLPGCGKTTLATSLAWKFTHDKKFKKRYKNVYVNFGVDLPGVTVIKNEYLGKYQLENGAVLLDEASLLADSRDYKNFSKNFLQFFLMHRHYNLDIYLFNQGWDAVDKRIRVITDRVYYIYKSRILGKLFSSYYRIPYDIIIPDPKGKNSGEKLGDIIQGYCKPPLLQRIFSHKIYRPRYYKYFDSWEAPQLDPLPSESQFSVLSQDLGDIPSLDF